MQDLSLRGKLPEAILKMGHFGPTLKSYLLYQYHHCHVTQPLLLKMMSDWGIDISSGQLNRILVEDKEKYHLEKQEILQVGLTLMIQGPATRGLIAIAHTLVMNGLHGLKQSKNNL